MPQGRDSRTSRLAPITGRTLERHADAAFLRPRRCDGTIGRVTPDLPPSSIAYAIPENDRADGRVRRVLAFAAIGFGAVGVGSTVLYLTLVLGLVPSRMYGAGRANPAQLAFQAAAAVFELLLLVGGVLLLRADLPAARLLIRIGAGGRVAALLAAIAVTLVTSPYPPGFTIADRFYMLLGNSIGFLIIPVTFFLLTFALPPRRAR